MGFGVAAAVPKIGDAEFPPPKGLWTAPPTDAVPVAAPPNENVVVALPNPLFGALLVAWLPKIAEDALPPPPKADLGAPPNTTGLFPTVEVAFPPNGLAVAPAVVDPPAAPNPPKLLGMVPAA